MRSFAFATIRNAAMAAGLTEDAVMEKPDKESVILPAKRLQVEYLPEALDRSPKRIAKFSSSASPDTHRTIRKQVYKRGLTVRAEVVSDDAAWLEQFVRDFLIALPHKTANAESDLVIVKATRAVRGGFGSKTVEVFKRRSNALHITFTGMICEDEDVPLITDVNLVDGASYQEHA